MSQVMVRVVSIVLTSLLLAACQPPEPGTPRATAPIILEITPAPTFDIDATATSYAQQLLPSPTPAGLYVVQPGDTLSGLAQDFGTTIEDIMAANGITDPDALQVGQTLIIPSLVDRPVLTAVPITPTVPPSATPIPPTNTPAPTRRPPPPTAEPPTAGPPTAEPPTAEPQPPAPTEAAPAPAEAPTATPAP